MQLFKTFVSQLPVSLLDLNGGSFLQVLSSAEGSSCARNDEGSCVRIQMIQGVANFFMHARSKTIQSGRTVQGQTRVAARPFK